jgi:hemerythrin superfamily protein
LDPVKMIKDDHERVEKLFKEFESAGDGAHKRRHDLGEKILEELEVHATLEEEIFYPRAGEVIGDRDLILESEEEHHVVETLMEELRQLDAEDERYKAKMMVLIENVRTHVKEEEREMLPKVKKGLGKDDLEALGAEMEDRKSALMGQQRKAS